MWSWNILTILYELYYFLCYCHFEGFFVICYKGRFFLLYFPYLQPSYIGIFFFFLFVIKFNLKNIHLIKGKPEVYNNLEFIKWKKKGAEPIWENTSLSIITIEMMQVKINVENQSFQSIWWLSSAELQEIAQTCNIVARLKCWLLYFSAEVFLRLVLHGSFLI